MMEIERHIWFDNMTGYVKKLEFEKPFERRISVNIVDEIEINTTDNEMFKTLSHLNSSN